MRETSETSATLTGRYACLIAAGVMLGALVAAPAAVVLLLWLIGGH